MRWSLAIVMAVPPFDPDLIPVMPTPVLVPIPVSFAYHYLGALPVIPVRVPVPLAYLYLNAADPDIGALRDDHRLVGDDRGTGKCRHGEEWNNT